MNIVLMFLAMQGQLSYDYCRNIRWDK